MKTDRQAVATRTTSRLFRGASLKALGWALTPALVGTMAHAQTTPAAAPAARSDSAVEEVVVTGIRASIEAAIHEKRISSSIVEVINAEDIGKLPDISIADAIANLPGVTAQRVNGRDQLITVRGFGQDYSTGLMNGRELTTTSNSRGLEYDQYPAELISSVVVSKTSDATLIGQGLVATVGLNTLRPLAQAGQIFALQARGEFDGHKLNNPDSANEGYRFSALYSNKFANDTLGVMIGGALESTPTQTDHFNSWGYPTVGGEGPFANDYVIGGAKSYGESDVLNRGAVVGTIEWEPNETFHTVFDAFYSQSVEKIHLRGVEIPMAWGGGAVTTPLTAANGIVDSATFSNIYPVQRNDFNQENSHTLNLGWNTKYRVTDKIEATLDLSWSRSHKEQYLLESYSGTGYNQNGLADTLNVTRNSNGTYNIAQTDQFANLNEIFLTDPNGWGGNNINGGPLVQAGYINKPYFEDDLKAARFDLKGDVGKWGIKDWHFGANYSERTKTSDFTADFLRLPNGATTLPIPAAALIGSGMGSPIGFEGVSPTLVLNQAYLVNNVYQVVPDIRPVTLTDDYSVREKVLVLFGQGDIDGSLKSIPITGNFGVQAVYTDQFSNGVSATVLANNAGVGEGDVTGGAKYWRVLPSLNLKADIAPGWDVRIAASRSMARARLDQEEATTSVNYNIAYAANSSPQAIAAGQTFFSASGGNPNLRPFMSDNFDLTIERYFGNSGVISLQTWFKHLTDFVDPNYAYVQNFSAFLSETNGIVPATTYGLVSGPANKGSGDSAGVEIAATIPFKMFTSVLDGFGVQAAGSYTSAWLKEPNSYTDPTLVNLQIEGLSRWVFNGSLYYEKYGFQARAKLNYRSSFLGEESGLSASRIFQNVAGEMLVDLELGYTIQSGPAKNLSILLQAKNITNEPFIDYQGSDPRLVLDHDTYGPTYLVNMSYKF
jgi:iron complex outermembrane receptor protein